MALFQRRLIKRLAWKLIYLPVLGPVLAELTLRRKYGAAVVTMRKVRNFLQANRESSAKATAVQSLPYILNLDTTNTCNLACPFCATGCKQLHRPYTRLPLEKAKALIDAAKDFALEARLYNWGEPFLNPDIFEIIRAASDSGIYTVISSNLSIKVKNLAERVIDSGLDHLRVSLDGTEQATLEKYRQRANFNLVRENIRSIVEEKKRRGVKKPEIHVVLLVFRHNEHEVPLLPQLKAEWGVDSFTASSAFIYDESFVPRNPRFQPITTVFENSCHYLYSELMVEADGHISPCCTNTDARFDIGTIEDLADVRAFWNAPAMQRLRAVSAGMRNPQTKNVLCHYCRFVGAPTAGPLSPLSPSMMANGERFRPLSEDCQLP